MKASLDTNVLIHFYRAKQQDILFDFFEDGVFIYEQIRSVELVHHGKDVLQSIDTDISVGKIQLYTNETLKKEAVLRIFEENVKENRLLYGAGDMGEVYAISLAQTIGAYSLVTDDVKQGGPYMSLLQLEYDVMPFTFSDILLLRYLSGAADEYQTVRDFNLINEASDLNWSLGSQLKKFIKRFWTEPYKEEERLWMREFTTDCNTRVKKKFHTLKNLI